MIRAWARALAAAGLLLLTIWTLHRGDGLTRTATIEVSGRDVLDEARVPAIDLRGLDAALRRESVTLRWEGVWLVPSTGVFDLSIESQGPSSWSVDDRVQCEVASPEESGRPRAVWLAAGFHRIAIKYEPTFGQARIAIAAATTGAPLQPLDAGALKPRLPRNPYLRSMTLALRNVLVLLLVIALVAAIRRTVGVITAAWRDPLGAVTAAQRARLGRGLAWSVLIGIVTYGGLLRLDAITAQYGPVTSPRWLAALQTRSILAPDLIRPDGFRWEPAPTFPHVDGPPTHYRSDPYTYLGFARQRPSFYAATFREPLFPFSTRLFLNVLNDQDVAVSFTSTTFAVLAIWFTYLLGAAVWSRAVGLLAAFGLAIDFDAVSLASAGWRDDAFVAVVALCGFAIVRWWRTAQERPRTWGPWRVDAVYRDAVWFGLAAGFACLVRVFALSFVIPGVAVMFMTIRGDRRRRLVAASLALAVAALIAAPYYLNCWRVYGDPFYTFSVHGNVYRVAEGQGESPESTSDYIRHKMASRPVEMLDTVALGLTEYPFSNKWRGLDRWRSGLGRWAQIAGLAGLVVLATTGSGRLLLFIVFMSVAPFSFTWRVDPTWRFTAHAYPFLLVGAGAAISAAWWCVRATLIPGSVTWPAAGSIRWGRQFLAWTAGSVAVLAAFWFATRVSPALMFAETLRNHGDAELTAGVRDAAFFGGGWSEVAGSGSVRMRVAFGDAAVSVPLPEAHDYPATIRIDPFPRPLHDRPDDLPVVEVLLNGTSLTRLPLGWNHERFGAYDLVLPRALVRRGANELRLRVQPATDAIALWYVRVHPPARKD